VYEGRHLGRVVISVRLRLQNVAWLAQSAPKL
jgi:hypothetical protein